MKLEEGRLRRMDGNYLADATEIYLKKLVVGGGEKIESWLVVVTQALFC